ncbi:hypothetical protein O59_004208 [Cellvibrio sp. BR]|nr:hypothetical protein O59_004208 [Cellvibrio sp. BR]
MVALKCRQWSKDEYNAQSGPGAAAFGINYQPLFFMGHGEQP